MLYGRARAMIPYSMRVRYPTCSKSVCECFCINSDRTLLAVIMAYPFAVISYWYEFFIELIVLNQIEATFGFVVVFICFKAVYAPVYSRMVVLNNVNESETKWKSSERKAFVRNVTIGFRSCKSIVINHITDAPPPPAHEKNFIFKYK